MPSHSAPSYETLPASIETERLLLRGPRPGDGMALNEALRESWADLGHWIEWAAGEPPSVEDSEAREMHAAEQFRTGEEFLFSAFLKETGQFVSKQLLFRLNWDVPKGEIGYWIRTRFEGQGLMTEAVRALTDFGLETLGLIRVEIRCDARNVRSAAVAARAGYALEGCLRNDCRDPRGGLRDTLVYSRVRRDAR